jgi:tetratricopeptide (TPR) repeat protein
MAEADRDSTRRATDIRTSVKHYSRAVEIYPGWFSGYWNLSLAYFKLHYPDQAVYNLDKVWALYPRYMGLDVMYYNVGVDFYMNRRYTEGTKNVAKLPEGKPQ